ncbi:MAG: hypothetical protein JNM00_05810, partial [Flavobacteriales bacterium]|nr:hypothetical protein [Flavobacteriales bacterium]
MRTRTQKTSQTLQGNQKGDACEQKRQTPYPLPGGSFVKQFDLPSHYRSSFTGQVKALRRLADPRKKDFSPIELNFGPVIFVLPRHFGFCYGVENAIEISYRAIRENPGKRIFLLSEMIHNP